MGKKDILATLHPGPPPAESSSLGTQQRKTLGVLSSLAGAARQAGQGDDINRGLLYFTFFLHNIMVDIFILREAFQKTVFYDNRASNYDKYQN